MSLTRDEYRALKLKVDRVKRKRLRLVHADQPRPYCEGLTELHTKCRNMAQEDSRFCGRHREKGKA